jgi:hypothetical protein
MSLTVRRKIAAVRRRSIWTTSAAGVCAAAALAALGLAAAMLLDWAMHLPYLARAALLGVNIAIIAYVVARFVLAPAIFAPDEDQIALSVERSWPQLQGRLIATVQLSRPGVLSAGESRALVEALVQQTEGLCAALDFRKIVHSDHVVRVALLAVSVLLSGIIAMAYAGETGHALL